MKNKDLREENKVTKYEIRILNKRGEDELINWINTNYISRDQVQKLIQKKQREAVEGFSYYISDWFGDDVVNFVDGYLKSMEDKQLTINDYINKFDERFKGSPIDQDFDGTVKDFIRQMFTEVLEDMRLKELQVPVFTKHPEADIDATAYNQAVKALNSKIDKFLGRGEKNNDH